MKKIQVDNGLDHITYVKVNNNDLNDVLTSPQACSETKFIKQIQTEFDSYGDKIQLTLVDTPGLYDTEGAEVEISNQIGIREAMMQAKFVKPVLIFSFKKFGDRGEDLKEVLKCYASMFRDIDLISYANVFFTHISG